MSVFIGCRDAHNCSDDAVPDWSHCGDLRESAPQIYGANRALQQGIAEAIKSQRSLSPAPAAEHLGSIGAQQANPRIGELPWVRPLVGSVQTKALYDTHQKVMTVLVSGFPRLFRPLGQHYRSQSEGSATTRGEQRILALPQQSDESRKRVGRRRVEGAVRYVRPKTESERFGDMLEIDEWFYAIGAHEDPSRRAPVAAPYRQKRPRGLARD